MRDERMLMADYLLMRRCLSGQTQRHVLPTLRSPPLDRVLKILVVASDFWSDYSEDHRAHLTTRKEYAC